MAEYMKNADLMKQKTKSVVIEPRNASGNQKNLRREKHKGKIRERRKQHYDMNRIRWRRGQTHYNSIVDIGASPTLPSHPRHAQRADRDLPVPYRERERET